MPQNNDATEQTSETENGNNLPEKASLRDQTNESAVTNSQEYNEGVSYDDPVFETTETNTDLIFQGPRHSSPLRHRVPPREVRPRSNFTKQKAGHSTNSPQAGN